MLASLSALSIFVVLVIVIVVMAQQSYSLNSLKKSKQDALKALNDLPRYKNSKEFKQILSRLRRNPLHVAYVQDKEVADLCWAFGLTVRKETFGSDTVYGYDISIPD